MQITVFTTTWCPSCKMAKMYLNSKGIHYLEVNIEKTPGAAELVMKEANGCRTVPTIVIEAAGRREVVVDWNRRALESVLDSMPKEA